MDGIFGRTEKIIGNVEISLVETINDNINSCNFRRITKIVKRDEPTNSVFNSSTRFSVCGQYKTLPKSNCLHQASVPCICCPPSEVSIRSSDVVSGFHSVRLVSSLLQACFMYIYRYPASELSFRHVGFRHLYVYLLLVNPVIQSAVAASR